MITINSNFTDYYDKELSQIDMDGYITRKHTPFYSKKRQFDILEMFGLVTPFHGTPIEVAAKCKANSLTKAAQIEVIVWPSSTETEPLMTSLAHAMKHYPSNFVTEYIVEADRSNVGHCIRCIYLGYKVLCFDVKNSAMQSSSIEQWRAGLSIHGGPVHTDYGNIEILDQFKDGLLNEANSMQPFYSCDIVSRGNDLYAVNYNPAPIFKDTHIEKVDATLMAKLISDSLAVSYELAKQ